MALKVESKIQNRTDMYQLIIRMEFNLYPSFTGYTVC